MKSEYFKRHSSTFSGTREKVPKNSINWDRIVYLTLLGLAFFALLYYLIDYNFVLKGQGRVYTDRHEVRFSVDVQILKMKVKEGDNVKYDDSLFIFIESSRIETPAKYRDEQRNIGEKLVNINSDINALAVKILNTKRELNYLNKQKELVKKEIKLDLSSVHDLRQIEKKTIDVRAEHSVQQKEINGLYQLRSIILEWQNKEISQASFPLETSFLFSDYSENFMMAYRAPYDGIIERIQKKEPELAIRSESIMTIRREEFDVFIQVVFPRTRLEKLSKGDAMQVIFDNGVKGRGIITDYYTPEITNWDVVGIAEYELNDHVVIRLKPEDSNERKKWKTNSNMGVTVRKFVL